MYTDCPVAALFPTAASQLSPKQDEKALRELVAETSPAFDTIVPPGGGMDESQRPSGMGWVCSRRQRPQRHPRVCVIRSAVGRTIRYVVGNPGGDPGGMSRRAPGIASHAPALRLQMQDQTTHQLHCHWPEEGQ